MKLDLAAVDATACGMEGTVNCDSRDTRPPRAGAGVALGVEVEGVAVAEEEAAAGFFMDVGGAGGAARRPPDEVDDVPAPAAAALPLAGRAFDGAADLTDATVAEAFLATATGCLAAGVFLTTGLEAGLPAWTTGFFTMTGSFDELERAFNG